MKTRTLSWLICFFAIISLKAQTCDLVIVTQPSASNQTLCKNVPASTLLVEATGTGPITYQWFSNSTGSNTGGLVIGGATSASFVPPTSEVGTTYYYVEVTSPTPCVTIASNVSGAITVNPPTEISSISPATQSVCEGISASILTASATGTGTLMYTWFYNPTNTTAGGTLVRNASPDPTFAPPSNTVGTRYYFARVAGQCGFAAVLPTAEVSVVPTTFFINQPSATSQTFCQNDVVPQPLNGSVIGGNVSYQWFSNTVNDNTTGTAIPGANSGTFYPPTITAGTTYYYVKVTASCGNLTSSVSGAITVNAKTEITAQPLATNPPPYCPNDAATPLTVTATGTNLSYQWYRNTSKTTSGATLITGAIGSSYVPPTTSAGTTYYYVVVMGSCGANVTSGFSGAIIVRPATAITTQPNAASNYIVTTYPAVVLSVTASGAGLLYEWYRNTTNNNTTGTSLGPASVVNTYPVAPITPGDFWYYVKVTGLCGAVTSNVSGRQRIISESEAKIITRIAGDGTSGLSGNGGLATFAKFANPSGIAIDPVGKVYISDAGNRVIRKIGTDGIVTTVAGTGTNGFSGDGGPATAAKLNFTGASGSTSIAVDASGHLYIADAGNNRIRKVHGATGIITTIAGTGSGTYSGDGGAATSAGLRTPTTIALDNAGNIYFGEYDRVRKINATTGIITTVAGGNGMFSANPVSIAVDNSGNIYASDASGNRVRKIDGVTGAATIIAGNGTSGNTGDDGPATSAQITAGALTLDAAGNLYLAASFNVRIINLTTGIISHFAGTPGTSGYAGDGGPAIQARFGSIGAVASDGSNIYIADLSYDVVRKVLPCIQGVKPYQASVAAPPSIPPPLMPQQVCQSAAAAPMNLFVFATGTVSYQWYSNAVAWNSGGTLIAGATSSSYTPPTAAPGVTYYYATVTSTCGSVPSGVFSVTVNGLTTQPSTTPVTTCQGNAITPLSAVYSRSTGISYQWHRSATASNAVDNPISGANGNSYTPLSSTPGTTWYFLVVTDITYGCSVRSNVSGAITVNAPTVITAQPSSAPQTVCVNGAPDGLSVAATGTSLSYQWHSNSINSNSGGTLINGATLSTYTPPATSPGTSYFYCVVTGSCGVITSSVSGPLTVNALTGISSHPSATSQTLCESGSAIPLSVTASGSGTFSYQWYSNDTNANSGGVLISDATAASYTPPSITSGVKYYYVTVTGACGAVTSLTSGEVTVNPLTTIATQPSPSSQTLCLGAPASILHFLATGSGTITYQWYSNTVNNNTTGVIIDGATGSSYDPPTTMPGITYYYASATGGCGTVVSSVSSVTVERLTSISAHPSSTSQTNCVNGSPAALSVTATGAGTLTYQWYSNTISSNSGGSPIASSNASSYTPASNSAGTNYYYVEVTGNCGTLTSLPSGSVIINPTTVINSHPSTAGQSVCEGGAATALDVVATGTGLSYQWYRNNSNSNSGGTLVSSAGPSYTPLTSSPGIQYYYATVTGSCGIATSNVSGAITVNAATAIATQPSTTTQSVCQGTPVNGYSVSASGTPNFTYQWFSNPTNSNSGGSFTGGTSSTYVPNPITTGTSYYYAVVSGACGSATSNTSGAVTVNAPPSVTLADPPSTVFCVGDDIALSATGSLGTYQWKLNGNPIGTAQQGVTQSTYYAVAQGSYTVQVTTSAGCSKESSHIHLWEGEVKVTISPSSAAICSGSYVRITSSWTEVIPDYQWLRNGSPIAGAINTYYDASLAGTYRLRTTNRTSGCVWISNASTISVTTCTPPDPCDPPSIMSAMEEEKKTKSLAESMRLPPCESVMSVTQPGVYPNPAKESLTIQLLRPAEQDVAVTIYDGVGVRAAATTIQSGSDRVTLSTIDLANGAYLIHIASHAKEKQKYYRVVIEH
jgi:large repetitive protein